jgi:hypothetical protein
MSVADQATHPATGQYLAGQSQYNRFSTPSSRPVTNYFHDAIDANCPILGR